MRKLLFFFALLLWQNLSFAQQHGYFGLRADISLIHSRPSESVDMKNSPALGLGIVYHYPFNNKWEMTADAIFSSYKIKGQTAENTGLEYEMTGIQALKVSSCDAHYSVLRGFGDDQKFKFGVGAWVGLVINKHIYDYSPYFANSVSSKYIYYWDRLFRTPFNYGLLLEGIYNVNDALQFSLRYKMGLANLYESDDETTHWRQNAIEMGVNYYFGGESRGKINSNKKSSNKSKYQW